MQKKQVKFSPKCLPGKNVLFLAIFHFLQLFLKKITHFYWLHLIRFNATVSPYFFLSKSNKSKSPCLTCCLKILINNKNFPTSSQVGKNFL